MENTDEQKAEYKAQFGAKRQRQIVLIVPMVAAIGVLVFSEGKESVMGISGSTVGVIGLVLFVFGLAFSLLNWRCPSCDKYLGKGLSPKFCPKCGVELS